MQRIQIQNQSQLLLLGQRALELLCQTQCRNQFLFFVLGPCRNRVYLQKQTESLKLDFCLG